jgi:hypothetical protein
LLVDIHERIAVLSKNGYSYFAKKCAIIVSFIELIMIMKNILIAGGTGLIGNHLSYKMKRIDSALLDLLVTGTR